MITAGILEDARNFARRPDTTYPGLKNFIERAVENEYSAATAARSGVALDAVSRRSFYDDDECMAAADEIWESLQEPNPMTFFNGLPYHEGLAAYRKHHNEGVSYRPKTKGAYLV